MSEKHGYYKHCVEVSQYQRVSKERDFWKSECARLVKALEDIGSHVCHPDCNHKEVAIAALSAHKSAVEREGM